MSFIHVHIGLLTVQLNSYHTPADFGDAWLDMPDCRLKLMIVIIWAPSAIDLLDHYLPSPHYIFIRVGGPRIPFSPVPRIETLI